MRKSILLAIIVVLLATEIVLRSNFGFCHAVLFKADNDYEYIPIPQKTVRFGKLSFYNHYYQRNQEIQPSDTTIILGFGDSVLNGGVTTEQDSLATSLGTKYLTTQLGRNVIFTNISAGSWGPDNSFAYLQKHGNFHAKAIFLQVSSHDAYDNIDHKPVVDIHQSYPSKQYPIAMWELIDRYVAPRIKKMFREKDNSDYEELRINKYKEGDTFNSGFQNFKNYSDSTGIPLVLYLHAERQERINGKYNPDGQKIIQFCETQKIPIINELKYNLALNGYRDKIHLSETGQHYMFEIIKNEFLTDFVRNQQSK